MSGRRFWQIAYPPQIRQHDHMPGPKRFLDGLIAYIEQQGDIAIVFPFVELPWTARGITLNFHTTGFAPNTYHYKESFLKDWVQIDRLGYTGFHSYNLDPAIMPVDAARLEKIGEKLKVYRQARISKYDQGDDAKIDGPYLFFPLQKPQDETSLFARFTPQQIVAAALPWCAANNVRLVIKRHPFCHSKAIENWLGGLNDPQIVITHGNVQDLIQDAKAVLTVNSSVGFEAMLNGKPTLNFGKAEYSSFAMQVDDLVRLPSMLGALGRQSTPTQRLEQFSAACLFDSQDNDDIAAFYNVAALAYDESLSAPFVSPPTIPLLLDLSEHGNAAPHILHGFSFAEEWGRWSNAPLASLVFHGDKAQKGDLRFSLFAYVNSLYPVQFHDIYWNHELVVSNQIIKNGDARRAYILPVAIQRGINVLTFVPHNAIRPADLADAHFDVRKLGLNLDRIEFAVTA